MPEDDIQSKARAAQMRSFALADWPVFDELTKTAADHPHEVLRGPDSGLVMLRGRMGGTGAAFNFGEASVTRCTVRLVDGTEGHSYVLGRNSQHAHRAALCDALIQAGDKKLDRVVAALQKAIAARQHAAAAKAAATKVDFFTMVRGDV